jgi:transcriptional regulator of arginine metabolism
MSSKQKRQFKIKELVASRTISSQEELVEILKKEGIDTTQATLSRDLQEMGIIRLPTERGFKYVLSISDLSKTLRKIVGLEIQLVLKNENCVVVKTLPGRAQGVAVYFDQIEESHIIGSVAGDDTIMLIPDSVSNIEKIVEKINTIVSGGKPI